MEEYKILEANGVENENIDGAAFNNFCAGGKDGIVKGILNECKITISNNTLTIAGGELIIQGFRIKLLQPTIYSFSAPPAAQVDYYLVATITVDLDRTVTFSLDPIVVSELRQDNLFETESGTYQVALCKFTHNTDNSLSDFEELVDVIIAQSNESIAVAIETALVPIQRELDNKYEKANNVSIDTMGVTVVDAANSGNFAGLYAYGIELVKNGTTTSLTPQETADSSSVNLLLPKKSGTLALDGALQDLEENIAINSNNIKALFNLQLEKNVLAYDNAELTEEVQQTGGSELANLTILDGSYATVNKISGNTVKCENLIPYPYFQGNGANVVVTKGITFTVSADGSITANGTATGAANFYLCQNLPIEAGTYYLSGNLNKNSTADSVYSVGCSYIDETGATVYRSADTTAITIPVNTTITIYFAVGQGAVMDNVVAQPMLNRGTTKLPYELYFEGLKNAKISGIKSSNTDNTKTNTMQLPQTFELGKWDYITFNESTSVAIITRRTSIEAFNEQDYNEAENTYQGSTDFILSVDKTLVARIDENLPNETFVFDSNKYLVWDNGTEQILTPTDTDGKTCFDYGANTTEENSYYVIVGDNA